MQKERIFQLIKQPFALQRETDLPLIKELTEEFPYFAAPYILLTRHLSQNKSIYLDKYLKTSATYIGNRELLYDIIFEEAPETKSEIVKTEPNIHISKAEKMPLEVGKVESENIEIPEKTEANQHSEKTEEIAEIEKTGLIAEVEKPETVLEAENAEDLLETQEPVSEINEVQDTKNEEIAEPLESIENTEIHIGHDEKMPQAEVNNETINATEPATNPTEPLETEKPRRKTFEGLEALPVAAYDYFAYQQKIAEKQKAAEEKEKLEAVAKKAILENPVTENSITESDENLIAGKTEIQEIDENASLSFSDWLTKFHKNEEKLQVKKPVNALTQAVTPSISSLIKAGTRKPARADVENIITNFIKQEPKKIKPQQASFYKPEDFAHRSAEEDNTLVTETLANIYLKQGLKEKALEIFQQLIIKYPQKSAYFAAKIQEINTNQ